jgi:hypothetical protein
MLTVPSPKVPIIAFALVVALEIERGFSPASRPSREAAYHSAEGWSEATKGEATDSIAVAGACFYFSRFRPKNRMSSPKTT